MSTCSLDVAACVFLNRCEGGWSGPPTVGQMRHCQTLPAGDIVRAILNQGEAQHDPRTDCLARSTLYTGPTGAPADPRPDAVATLSAAPAERHPTRTRNWSASVCYITVTQAGLQGLDREATTGYIDSNLIGGRSQRHVAQLHRSIDVSIIATPPAGAQLGASARPTPAASPPLVSLVGALVDRE
jgi:hypothetical protein